MTPRIISGVIGLFYLAQALNWLAKPLAAAEALGMPLLEGMGRSTQIGDFSAFFFTLGALGLLGAYHCTPSWPRAGALLIGSAGITRTLSWLIHGAPFAFEFIVVEFATAGLLLFAAYRFQARESQLEQGLEVAAD